MHDAPVDAPEAARAGEHVTVPDNPPAVLVWIVSGRGRAIHAEGNAIAWTPRQVHVSYIDPGGRFGRAWVWANAVTRR